MKTIDALFVRLLETLENHIGPILGFVVVFGFSLFAFEFLRVFLKRGF